MTIADDVVWMCADSPGAVDVVNSHGQSSRGPRRQLDVEVPDAAGLTRLKAVTALVLPATHLDRTTFEDVVTVTEDDATTTAYVVKDIQLLEDGRAKRLIVIAQ